MIPGAIIAVPLNLIGFDILVCPFTDCRGSLDGGPIAKYEVTTISITFGILYALLAIGIDKLIRKTKSHKNKKQA